VSGGARVLVVEDEALVAMLLEDSLGDAGFGVEGPYATIEQALSAIARNPPDAAVLDLNLSGESSVPVADALAAAGVPFVFCSGYGDAGVPTRHAGRPVLAKPCDPATLVAAIRRLLRE
jgi:DNA-binding response OmpR family regulator